MEGTLNKYIKEIDEISKASGWRNTKKSYEHYAVLVISEMCESINADRKSKYANLKTFEQSNYYNLIDAHLHGTEFELEYKSLFNKYIKDTYEDEIADICIRLLDIASIFNVNIYLNENVELQGYTLTEKMFYIIKEFTDTQNIEYNVNVCLNKIFKLFGNTETLYKYITYKIEYNKYNAKTHNKKY